MSKPSTRPDLLVRFENLKPEIGSFKFEALYNLPANLLGKMRMGMYNTAASEKHMRRLEAALDKYEKGDMSSLPEDAAPMGRPRTVTTLTGDDADLVQELIDMVETSADIAQVDQCNKKLTILMLKGLISDSTGRVIKELLAERRQSLNAKQEREDKAKGDQVMRIEIHNKADWSQPGPCPYCAGTGQLS